MSSRALLDETPALASSLLLMLSVWLVVGATQVAGSERGSEVGLVLGFGIAAAAVLRWRPRRALRFRPLSVALGFASGFVSYPAWVASIAWLGLALGLPASDRVGPALGGSPMFWLCAAGLGPVFEELLYRERLLTALRGRVGPMGAILASSGLFAISHLVPWSVLGTFFVGLALGAAYCVGRSIALCVALHAGVNVACLSCGMPPVERCLLPLPSAAAGFGLMLAALALLRGGRFPRPAPSPARVEHG
jgi:membrane protease YdiL (CAAX protease family)